MTSIRIVRGSRNAGWVPRIVSPALEFVVEGLALKKPPLPIKSIYWQIRQFAALTRRASAQLWNRLRSRASPNKRTC